MLTNKPSVRVKFPGILAPETLCFVQSPRHKLDDCAFGNPDPADRCVVEWESRDSRDGRPYTHAFFADCIEIRKLIEELSRDFDV